MGIFKNGKCHPIQIVNRLCYCSNNCLKLRMQLLSRSPFMPFMPNRKNKRENQLTLESDTKEHVVDGEIIVGFTPTLQGNSIFKLEYQGIFKNYIRILCYSRTEEINSLTICIKMLVVRIKGFLILFSLLII